MEAHGQVRKRRHLQLDGIAHDERAGRNGGGWRAVEGQRPAGARDDARALAAQTDVRSADVQLAPAVGV